MTSFTLPKDHLYPDSTVVLEEGRAKRFPKMQHLEFHSLNICISEKIFALASVASSHLSGGHSSPWLLKNSTWQLFSLASFENSAFFSVQIKSRSQIRTNFSDPSK